SIDRALETLWKCPEEYRHWEWGHLLYLCHQEAASFQAHNTNLTATIFSPDGRWVGTHDAAGLAKVWDWEAEQVVISFGSSSNRASWITFRPSGGQLAAILGTNGVCIWATTNWTTGVERPDPAGTATTTKVRRLR
ncbi:MAG: WD40 repeat domain-containing protein, partial [Verrucomicrobia bacterium]|nr:WD40 repeat domain-containing protein [Verrucomicrobiota bacterium]